MIWQLWRQDDNGNRFLVGGFATREQAELRMAGLSSGLHKQIYWISKTCEQGQSDTGGSHR